MRELPPGTVTFLFTDVEGSTRLLQEVGASAYAAILAEHRQVIRDSCARHNGVEVDTQGDAFFIAFPSAPEALAAAQDAQQTLSIPVRMGMHTGTPLLTSEGYVGADVHEAARIGSAGHGGQILLSATTAALVGTERLRDLGEHRLKDLSAPVRIYQAGADDFPPLKTLYRTNLPVSASAFVGRTAEIGQVREMVGRGDVRLLTLTGPGGCGKTRLALQAAAAMADSYPHGVWWVPLAPLTDPGQVVAAAARALGGAAPLEDSIGDRRLLLLLDNFEHVIGAAGEIADLLTKCPNVKLLVTSRERLRIGGEHIYVVSALNRVDARTLFVERARATQPEFEPDDLIDDLCVRLDELPLAIELAAARMSLLSTHDLLDRLGGRLDLLRGSRDADARQQTLRATIEWSYDLLEPEEQHLLAAMSVFRAPFTLAAAEEVAAADVTQVESLIDKNLLRRLANSRLGMLEMIREFACEKLAPSDRDRLMRRLLGYLIELFVPTSEERQYTREPADIALAEAERPNIDLALGWAREAGETLAALTLVTNLEFYWPTHDPRVGQAYVDEFLGAAGDRAGATLRARGLRLRGATFNLTGRDDLSAAEYEEALRILRELGNDGETYHLMHRIALGALGANDVDRAVRLATEALDFHREQGRGRDEAAALGVLANAAFAQGDLAEGFRLCRESAAVADRVGFTWWKGIALTLLAEQLLAADETQAALQPAADGLEALGEVDDRVNIPVGLAVVASLAARRQDASAAGLIWGALEAIVDSEVALGSAAIQDYQPYVAALRGPEFEDARQRGHSLPKAEAVSAAVDFARTMQRDGEGSPPAS